MYMITKEESAIKRTWYFVRDRVLVIMLVIFCLQPTFNFFNEKGEFSKTEEMMVAPEPETYEIIDPLYHYDDNEMDIILLPRIGTPIIKEEPTNKLIIKELEEK